MERTRDWTKRSIYIVEHCRSDKVENCSKHSTKCLAGLLFQVTIGVVETANRNGEKGRIGAEGVELLHLFVQVGWSLTPGIEQEVVRPSIDLVQKIREIRKPPERSAGTIRTCRVSISEFANWLIGVFRAKIFQHQPACHRSILFPAPADLR